MILGIDASNARAGGGVTYLTNLLRSADPGAHGIERVLVWAPRATLDGLPARDWLDARHDPLLEGALAQRLRWQQLRLPALAAASCDVLLVPGGNAATGFRPLLTMCRNMLPFEPRELLRYGFTSTTLRLLALRLGQARTFHRADGVIFLTRYAREVVTRKVRIGGRVGIVPHGVEERFRIEPRAPRSLAACSAEDPLRLLYVSIVDAYKHQDHVAEAVVRLRRGGLPVALDLVGPAYPPSLRRLRRLLARRDPEGRAVRYRGAVPFESIHELHARADAFVFASSCENMPNILLEAMAAGLPIACSDRGPMPEVLGDAGVLFDPERPERIAAAVRELAEDPELRARKARAAYERSLAYSWQRCARETLEFIVSVVRPEATEQTPS